MCSTCETMICAMFDRLAADYFRSFPPVERDEHRRPKYMPADVSNAAESAASKNGFSEMADAADGIGMTRMAFLTELSQRTGFGDAVMGWATGKIPNGLVRKIILTAAEDILRERGASPEYRMAEAA